MIKLSMFHSSAFRAKIIVFPCQIEWQKKNLPLGISLVAFGDPNPRKKALTWLNLAFTLLNCVWNLRKPTLLAWQITSTSWSLCSSSINELDQEFELWSHRAMWLIESVSQGDLYMVVNFRSLYAILTNMTVASRVIDSYPLALLSIKVVIRLIDSSANCSPFVRRYRFYGPKDMFHRFTNFFYLYLATMWKKAGVTCEDMQKLKKPFVSLPKKYYNGSNHLLSIIIRYMSNLDVTNGRFLTKAIDKFFKDYADLEVVTRSMVEKEDEEKTSLDSNLPPSDHELLPTEQIPVVELIRRMRLFFVEIYAFLAKSGHTKTT